MNSLGENTGSSDHNLIRVTDSKEAKALDRRKPVNVV